MKMDVLKERASTIYFDTTKWELHIGKRIYKVVKNSSPIFGSKKIIYLIEGTPQTIRKTIQTTDVPGRPKHSLLVKFRAMEQAIQNQELLEKLNIPHLNIIDVDPEGPPYRDYGQEDVPEGSISAVDLIRKGLLTDEDIKQIASYINTFELEKKFQLDTNPYNWYRVNTKEGITRMTYVDGKVYAFEKDWEFRKVGLLQWLDSSFLAHDDIHTARIPRDVDFAALQKQWQQEIPAFAPWKKYLNSLLQP
jgi:hypothetical protein